MSFPPPQLHGPLERVADGVHVVRGSFQFGRGVRIGRTMTVLEHGGDVIVLNPVRVDAATEASIEKLGPLAHLVKLADSHSHDDAYYASRVKHIWALPGAALSGFTATQQLGPGSPIAGATVIEYPGISGWRECGLLVPAGGGTLITCDAVQNHADTLHSSFIAKLITPLLGFKGGVLVAPRWRQRQNVAGDALRAAFAPLLEHRFENVVTGHGPAQIGGADQLVRAAVERAAFAR